MGFFDIPYLVEVLFIMCVLLFIITLYIVVPTLVFDKKTFYKTPFAKFFWRSTPSSPRNETAINSNNPNKKKWEFATQKFQAMHKTN